LIYPPLVVAAVLVLGIGNTRPCECGFDFLAALSGETSQWVMLGASCS
jgi:hypothetical protein